jgi:TldD protein
MMKNLAYYALDAAARAGVQYADVRVVEKKSQTIGTKNQEVCDLEESEGMSLGVRVLVNVGSKSGWGFASPARLTPAAIAKSVDRAIDMARVSARCHKGRIILAPEGKYEAEWTSRYQKDPFEVSIEDKVKILLAAAKIMGKVKGIDLTTGSMSFGRERKLFVSTLGSCIWQTTVTSSCGIDASAFDVDGRYQTRSYPTSFGGQFENAGFEMIEKWDLVGNAERVASEAVELCSAPVCPEITTSLILESSQLGLQIHESCGHAVELDRVFGEEVNYAGTSFLVPKLRNKLKYGSNIVNLIADATDLNGLGCFGFDDEGVPAQNVDLVKDGLFVGYLSSRESAATLGLERSGGAMRAESASCTPLIRMTNVSLKPGDGGTLDDIIADTKSGVLLATNKSWSIDDKRLNFQFGTEVAWEIKNGKKRRMLRDASYYGMTPQFWNSCDRIGSDSIVWGIPTCAKAQPCQMVGTGHGAPTARFKRVKVGVAIPTMKQGCAK